MARRQIPLVTQHLENISRTALESYEEIVRQFVRRHFGIYALYRRNKLYYLGLASTLRSRLTRHLRDRHAETWDRFSVYLTIGRTTSVSIMTRAGVEKMGAGWVVLPKRREFLTVLAQRRVFNVTAELLRRFSSAPDAARSLRV